MSHRILVVAGTRPEVIKVAPVVRALDQADGFEPVLCVTRQHDSLLDQAVAALDLTPDVDLDVFTPGASMTSVLATVIDRLGVVIAERRPHVVLVQGDTLSTFAGAVAGHYGGVPVAHLEAGLRSGLRNVPYPEEVNRRATTQIADIHLAPTEANRVALRAEKVPDEDIFVTGNTGIDSLRWMLDHPAPPAPDVAALDLTGPVVLVTAHRRESWDGGLAAVAGALAELLERHPDLDIVLPAHANPAVRAVFDPLAASAGRFHLIDPVGYPDLCRLLGAATLVLTDSGGIQEEAPALGLPVLVLRDATERTEVLDSGLVELVGTDPERIVRRASARLTEARARIEAGAEPPPPASPFGDGHAAGRVVAALRHVLDGGPRPEPFRRR